MPLRPDLVGTSSEPYEFSWNHEDTMLYAVAVGAGAQQPGEELAFTTENTEGLRPAVLPTFANIITRGARVDLGDYDRTKLVHAEQSFSLSAPLPTSGRARVVAQVTGLYDKGSGAMISTQATATDVETGAPLATSVQTVFIRGEGGFGGPRGESEPWSVPEAEPDHVITYRTGPGQALLYRLTGDRNPLHSDPAFAARGGFDRPILHGMCSYGFTGRALLQSLCDGDPAGFHSMQARFTKPVLPGDELTVLIWRDGTGNGASFRTLRGDDPVLDRGRIELLPG